MRLEKLGTQGLVEYAWRLVADHRVLYYRFLHDADEPRNWKPVAY